jgi:hypothetical protein
VVWISRMRTERSYSIRTELEAGAGLASRSGPGGKNQKAPAAILRNEANEGCER